MELAYLVSFFRMVIILSLAKNILLLLIFSLFELEQKFILLVLNLGLRQLFQVKTDYLVAHSFHLFHLANGVSQGVVVSFGQDFVPLGHPFVL